MQFEDDSDQISEDLSQWLHYCLIISPGDSGLKIWP